MTDNIPGIIKRHITGKEYTVDETGCLSGTVYLFDDMVLKTESYTDKTESTVEIMRWLGGKLPVPEVIEYEIQDDMSYLLMSRIKGTMSCDKHYLEHPDTLFSVLAKGLEMLWSVDISDCPRVRDPGTELSEARERVEKGLVDMDNWEPGTKEQFRDPSGLLDWLENNKPAYEPVLSHGDFCLPNILIENNDISGFIDLGDCGIGDRWRDLSLCWRSLRHNSDGTFGNIYPGIKPDMLFEKLGIEPNHEKLRYYILLDELF